MAPNLPVGMRPDDYDSDAIVRWFVGEAKRLGIPTEPFEPFVEVQTWFGRVRPVRQAPIGAWALEGTIQQVDREGGSHFTTLFVLEDCRALTPRLDRGSGFDQPAMAVRNLPPVALQQMAELLDRY